MRKLALLSFAVVSASLVVAGVALAGGAGAVSMTQTFHNQVDTFHDVVPCTNAPATITTTSNCAVHVTFLTSGIGAGTFWFTITQTRDVTITPDGSSLPTYTGSLHLLDGDNGNLKNSAGTFILEVRLFGSDGSIINGHLLEHESVSASGISLDFFKAVCA